MFTSTKETEQRKMLKVKITYKSGRVDIVGMKSSDYTNNLFSLAKDNRLVGFEIIF